MLITYIPTAWLREKNPRQMSIQKELNWDEVDKMNSEGYGAYFYPNQPKNIKDLNTFLKAKDFDSFYRLFIDVDFKQGIHTKESILSKLDSFELKPSLIVNSGNGVHAYWEIYETQDKMLFLLIQRRLAKHFNSDIAVAQLKQLMRLPGSKNTKDKDNFKSVDILFEQEVEYKIEQFDKLLTPADLNDELACKRHLESTLDIVNSIIIPKELPLKFKELLNTNEEVKNKWGSQVEDRSKRDVRIGHIMKDNGFSSDEIMAVMLNTEKALERRETHRVNYAKGIVEAVMGSDKNNVEVNINSAIRSVKQIISNPKKTNFGAKLQGHELFDNTIHGFRLGQVLGLIGGSGIGKTGLALNNFKWFAEKNPQFDHLFVALEQPEHEIAERMIKIAGGDSNILERVHILTNFDANNNYRGLDIKDIKNACKSFELETGRKLGCVVIDHIGALKGDPKKTEIQNIMSNSIEMKTFAEELQVFLIMQSQAGREKAGIGDVELGKDAAYGSVYFESYCDWVVTTWQPLKRVYHKGAPTCIAYKFAKKRHKNEARDRIKEDVSYLAYFDPDTEQLREMTNEEFGVVSGFWQNEAIKIRMASREKNSLSFNTLLSSTVKSGEINDGTVNSDTDSQSSTRVIKDIGA